MSTIIYAPIWANAANLCELSTEVKKMTSNTEQFQRKKRTHKQKRR